MLGPNKNEISGRWEILCECKSREIKIKAVILAGHGACFSRIRSAYQVLVENPFLKHILQDWEGTLEDNIKIVVRKLVWVDLVGIELDYNPVAVMGFGDTLPFYVPFVGIAWELVVNYDI